MLPTEVLIQLVFQVTVAAAVVKVLIDLYSWVVESVTTRNWSLFGKRLASIILSVGFCLYTGLNVMPSLGAPSAANASIGMVLTGLLMARGANYINDVLRLIPQR